jgi:PAS domain S-box-containing protein
LAAVVELVDEAVVLLDPQRRVVSMNACARRLFRQTLQAVQGKTFATLLAPSSRRRSPRPSGRGGGARQGVGAVISERPCTGLRSDGVEFAMNCRIVCVAPAAADARDLSAPGFSHAVYLQDLSRQAGLAEELHATQRRLQALVDLAPIAIWVTDKHQLQFANRAAARLLGAPSGTQLAGRSVFSLLHEQAHASLQECMARALQHEGRLERLQARLLRHDGALLDVEIALAALPDHGCTTVQMVVTDVSQRNAEMRELEHSRQSLRRLSASVVDAREAERRRIARELHDELGQGLSALKMEISACAASGPHIIEPERLASVMGLLDGVVLSVRRIAADLRPLMLDDLGLGDAVQALAQDFAQRHGVRVDVQLRLCATGAALDERVSTAMYRIVQEALNNVARHASARHVCIVLVQERAELTLTVADDGVGVAGQPPLRDDQFGVLGMRERAQALSGSCELLQQPGGGACLRVRVPWPGAEPVASRKPASSRSRRRPVRGADVAGS